MPVYGQAKRRGNAGIVRAVVEEVEPKDQVSKIARMSTQSFEMECCMAKRLSMVLEADSTLKVHIRTQILR